jgi:hypothetical protein
MMVTRSIGLIAAAAVLTLTAGAISASGASASASNAPSITLSQPTFTQYASDFVSYPDFNNWDAGFTFHWTIKAPAGICSQTLTYANYDTLGGDVDPVLNQDSETVSLSKWARSYAARSDTMDFSRSGYSVVIRMKECNGRHVTSNPVHTVIQPGEDIDPAMHYSKGWSVSHCSCWSDATTHRTSSKNASVSFQTAAPYDHSGVDVALVMPKASNRGSADVYVDGVRRATVNTYSKTAMNRTIVYQVVLSGWARHTVKIVNLATHGHPRIDFDATINGG